MIVEIVSFKNKYSKYFYELIKLSNTNDFIFGIAYRYTNYDDDTTATFNENLMSNDEEIINLPGLFIQDEIKIGEIPFRIHAISIAKA